MGILSGCSGAESVPGVEGRSEGAFVQEAILVVGGNTGPMGIGAEADVRCLLGGAHGEIEREREGRIQEGMRELVVQVSMTPTYSGVQFGYAIDPDNTIVWLPPFRMSGEHVEEIGPGASEEDGIRWHFFHRMNIEPEQDCYTGGGAGQLQFQILARR